MVLNYSEVVKNLESRSIMPDRPPALDVTIKGLERLNISVDPARVIVIAGTNGKGSVAATLHHLLDRAGVRTGLYTSPHLIETTERIRIGNSDVSKELFSEAFQ